MMMTAPRSEAERIAGLPDDEYEAWFRKRTKGLWEYQPWNWAHWRRNDQTPPDSDWRIWFVMAGRGFGKTRMAAEWVRGIAEADGNARIALVGATMHDTRSVMVEGESGLLGIAPPDNRPVFEPSLKRLVWANGAMAYLYSAAEPESLRGPQHTHGWGDEIAKWDHGVATWDNLELTMRIGDAPRIVATTTPRPVALVRQLATLDGVAITRGSMDANRWNLAAPWLDAMRAQYGGTRLGRQELDGELIGDIDHGLWPRDLIERCRVASAPTPKRVVIGVDPPASSKGDACGIIVVGLGADGRAYVLADASVEKARPDVWAQAVANAADTWDADCVIAEANNGGEMVESTLRNADILMPVRRVTASRGKSARAEPVSMLYVKGQVCHVGSFPALEDQMCGLTLDGRYEGPGRSPDRADALVWAVGEVIKATRAGPSVRWL